MTDLGHPTRKGGHLASDPARPSIAFSAIRSSAAPAHPAVKDNTANIAFGVDLNNEIGDCEVADFVHVQQIIRTILGIAAPDMPDTEIIAIYKTQNPDFDINGDPNVNGPGSPADGGMVTQTLLEYLLSADLIAAFAKVDHTNSDEVNAAVDAAGALVTAATLTQSNVVSDVDAGLWDHHPGEDPVGGHAFATGGYNESTGRRREVTWGMVLDCTAAFWTNQVSETWWILLKEQLTAASFDGIDIAALASEYQAVTGKPFPAVVPPAPPAPVPPAPTPSPVPPAPVTPPPAPPSPPVDVDAALWAEVANWTSLPHVGANRKAARAVRAWAVSKGYLDSAAAAALDDADEELDAP